MKFHLPFFLWILLAGSRLFAQPVLQVIRMDQEFPRLTGSAIYFLGTPRQVSGTQETNYAFQLNTDSLYLARFAPFSNPNTEPLVVYLKCYMPGAVYSPGTQEYDGFSPGFAPIGGINLVAYLKPDYDEFRFWNGTAWSAANTNLRPFFNRNATIGSRMEVAIPWSATGLSGIPDSVDVVVYQINGNSNSPFSYAQMPSTLEAGNNANPGITAAHRIRVYKQIDATHPLNFNETLVGSGNQADLLVYNRGTSPLNVSEANFPSFLPANQPNAFSIPTQPQSPVPAKGWVPFQVAFNPSQELISYEAQVRLPNNSGQNPFEFTVLGKGAGDPAASFSVNGNPIDLQNILYFGDQIPTSTQAFITLNVHSTGGDTLTMSPFIGQNPTQFKIDSVRGTVLPPGATGSVYLRFTGSATEGTFSGRINLSTNQGESSPRIDLGAIVVQGQPNPAQMKLIHLPRKPIANNGQIGNDWLAGEKKVSSTPGLDWYIRSSPDTLYLGRSGGNNAEPSVVAIQVNKLGLTSINQGFSYDGTTPVFTGVGGLHFMAYLKEGYDEYRVYTGTNWGPANTSLRPRFTNQSGNPQMEVAIPWKAITRSSGIPDTLSLVLYQHNGNSAAPFVYGTLPAALPGGAQTSLAVNQTFRQEVYRVVDTTNAFDFGSTLVGTSIDTTLLIYNLGPIAATPGSFQFPNTDFSYLDFNSFELNAGEYTPARLQFLPSVGGSQQSDPTLIYSSDDEDVNLLFRLKGTGTSGPAPNIRIRCGNFVLQPFDTLNFGDLTVGFQKDTLLWVVNTGNDTLRLSNPGIIGSGFQLPGTPPTKLAVGDSANIRIRFNPLPPGGGYSGQFSVSLNVPNLNTLNLYLTGNGIPVSSRLEIRQISNNLINTSGNIPASQLESRFLLSDNAGIKWYATWDTANLYIVKLGGNRAEPQLIYLRASYPGAKYTDLAPTYDLFHPSFTGMGGINFVAYLKESAIPYDEFRTWNGTLWSGPDNNLLPQYGNQAGQDQFAVRIPWEAITQGHGIADSIRLVLYQTNGNQASFNAYGQSPVGLPSGNAVTPPVSLSHNFTILHKYQPGSSFQFGTVPLGKHADTTFLFANVGDPGSTITLSAPQVSGSAYSRLAGPGAGTIAAGKWKAVRIRFAPQALGAQNGSMLANGNFDFPDVPYPVQFQGNGGQPLTPAIKLRLASNPPRDILPTGSIDLGILEAGTLLDTLIRIVNTGSDTLKISGFGPTQPGWTLTSSPNYFILPGDSAVFQVGKSIINQDIQSGLYSFNTNVPGLSTFQFSVFLRGEPVLSWFPPQPTIQDSITLVYRSNFGNRQLTNVRPVYIHTGVITSPGGTNWENIQGTFSQPADSVRLDSIGPNLHRMKFRIRDFYNLVGNPLVYRLGMVFRNGTGTQVGKTRTDGDFFIPINPNIQSPRIEVRNAAGLLLQNGDTMQFGLRPYGSQHDSLVVVKNIGEQTLKFTLANLASFSFTQLGTFADSLLAGQSDTLHFRLNVNGFGPLEGFLNFVSNASNSPGLLVNLRAQGIVSAADVLTKASLQLVPNPAREQVWIQNLETNAFVEVLDLSGKSLRKLKIGQGEAISLQGLPMGTLLLRIQLPDGSTQFGKLLHE